VVFTISRKVPYSRLLSAIGSRSPSRFSVKLCSMFLRSAPAQKVPPGAAQDHDLDVAPVAQVLEHGAQLADQGRVQRVLHLRAG
jgi:hypothetical protein